MKFSQESRSRSSTGDGGPLLISLDKDTILSGKRMMSSSLKVKKGPVIALVLSVVVILFIIVTWKKHGGGFINLNPSLSNKAASRNTDYSVWPQFTLPDHSKYNMEWVKSKCLGTTEDFDLENIVDIREKWLKSSDPHCQEVYEAFSSIFTITQYPGQVVIPDTFAVKVRKWLKNDENLFQNVKKQTIMYVFNEYTREENVFNPLREKRPMSVPDRPEREYVNEQAQKTAPTCDFCKYKTNTAEDVFGRVESEHSFTAANTFKLGAWHTLALTKSHHPLDWTRPVWIDLMHTCQKWFKIVYDRDNSFQHPMMIMDLLPHGGASQIHPHIHLLMDKSRYQGAVENWRIGAEQYAKDFPGRNYFTDLAAVHTALGLAVTYGKAVAFASLLPKKDNEVVIMSEEVGEDYFNLVYFVIRALLDDMQKLCYSSGYAFPNLDKKQRQGRIPAYTRIISRGAVADVRSDISSLELFTSQNANTNPYKVIDFVRKSIEKRKGS